MIAHICRKSRGSNFRFVPGVAGAVIAWAWLTLLFCTAAGANPVWVRSEDPRIQPPPPLREFRAAWVATVANIDWPSSRTLSAAAQREEIISILNTAHRLNLNAVVLQVRPSCDTIYPSTLEPWSEFLTGTCGSAPNPPYDPLAVWIEEAHSRGIELHAWFNPFRARHFESKTADAPNHISQRRPDLVKSYDKYLWLDPGEPDAQAHSLAVIMDVVGRYDIDGVHFDDYFYPYPVNDPKTKAEVPFPDDPAWQKYRARGGTLERSAWRRDNIDHFMSRVYEEVKKAKPHVLVGISPFGIWRPGFPEGVKGFDAYTRLNADSRRWLHEGWLDYLTPQLYWKISAPEQPYTGLLEWWVSQNQKHRHLWPGNNASKVLAKDAKDSKGAPAVSWEAEEVLQQISITRRTAGASGNVLFSMQVLVQNRRGLADSLASGPYARPAIPPESAWLAPKKTDGKEPARPNGPIVKIDQRADHIAVAWAGTSHRWAVQVRRAGEWQLFVLPGTQTDLTIPAKADDAADAITLTGFDRLFAPMGTTVMVRK